MAGLSDLVRDTEAVFSTALDTIIEADPTAVTVVGDTSDHFRRARLWLEAMLRKTPVAIADSGLTTAHRGLADPLNYQLKVSQRRSTPTNCAHASCSQTLWASAKPSRSA